MRTWSPLLVLSGLLVACDGGSSGSGSGSSGIDPGPTSAGTTTADPGSSVTGNTPASTSGADTTTTAPDDDGPEPPVTFDLGTTPDVGELDDGCNAVDFLFVIDNSGSMGTAQDNLVANFPTFIDGIQSTLSEVQSYHVGVVSSDVYDGNSAPCDRLGGLITRTTGFDSSEMTCGPYAEGHNYITEEDDLGPTFQCAAQIGTSGDASERPMNAMEAAISPDLTGEGACNEGFIRDNALLVVVIITDEADGPGDGEGAPPNSSTGDADSWYQSVLDAKGGIPENAAALVLTNYEGGPCPPAGFGFDDGVNMVNFATLFGENGFVAGICEPDYGPSFSNATAVIEAACDNFIPPG